MKKSLLLAVLIWLFSGCGGSSGGGSGVAASGVIVDPYIEGAVLCEDKNTNGRCDSGEQESTPSNSNGVFTFATPLTAGSHVIVKTQGLHNGIEYDLDIAGIVDSNKNIRVVSPLTTLETKGLTKTQIVALLTNAGISGLSEADIGADPMSGLGGKTTVSDSELKKLQASLATYGLLKIAHEVDIDDLTSPANAANLTIIATAMVSAIKSSLNQTTFNTIKTQTDAVKQSAGAFASYVPNVTTDVIIKTAVTVMDRIVKAGVEKANLTGDVTQALTESYNVRNSVIGQIEDIGLYYYGLENKSLFQNIPSNMQSFVPQSIKDGIANQSGVVDLNDEISFREKVNTLWGLVELNGGTLGNDTITVHKLHSQIVSLKITNPSNVTTTYPFGNQTLDLALTSIADGKNKLSIVMNTGDEKYLYFYKGEYDATDFADARNGDTNYNFSGIKADSVIANDMFVMVDNFNDPDLTTDDRWVYMLPNNNNQITVKNLKASGGYRVTSMEYEQYVVSNVNATNAGQDVTINSAIGVRKFVSGQNITGTFKKMTSTDAVPFTQGDLATESIWLHAHYTHPSALYTATCKQGSTVCTENKSGNVWVGAQDLHLNLQDYQNQSANYNLISGTYIITNLAQNTGYLLLAFWNEKGILGWEYNVASPNNNNVVLSGETAILSGTLADSYTQVRVARVTTFSGQPNISYSNIVQKNSGSYSVAYHYDTPTTTTYLIYGDSDDVMTFEQTCGATTPERCALVPNISTSTVSFNLPPR